MRQNYLNKQMIFFVKYPKKGPIYRLYHKIKSPPNPNTGEVEVEKNVPELISNSMKIIKQFMLNRKKWLLLSLLAVVYTNQGCVSEKITISENPEKDAILRVGLTLDGSPQFVSTANDGSLQGLEAELITMFAKKHNYLLETSIYSRIELLFALRRGEIDIAIPAATNTYISENFLQPCAPHLKTGQRILVNDAISMFIKDKNQLNDEKVTVLTPVGSTSANFAKKVIPDAQHISLRNIESCIKKALTNNGYIIMLDADKAWKLQSKKFILNSNANKGTGKDIKSTLKVVLPPLTNEQISWAVRRDNIKRKNSLNAFIKELEKNGKLKEMIEKNSANIINE